VARRRGETRAELATLIAEGKQHDRDILYLGRLRECEPAHTRARVLKDKKVWPTAQRITRLSCYEVKAQREDITDLSEKVPESIKRVEGQTVASQR